MFLKNLLIRNFRSLEDIEVDFKTRISVIVGPNAIGKTTLLEAIRFAKALLSPRTQPESGQTALSLSAMTAFNQQSLIAEAIARDVQKPVHVRCLFRPTHTELDLIQSQIESIAASTVLASGGRNFVELADRIATLSTPAGQKALQETAARLSSALQELRNGTRELKLELVMDQTTGITSVDQEGAAFFTFLDRRLPPDQTIFSYFPADRSIPTQEQAVQIGQADASQMVESHNSQPQLKFQRLKNTVFNAVIKGPEGRAELDAEFSKIFERLLRGRKLRNVGVNQYGMLTILIEDTDIQRTFSLDAMSSGEKGLILLFLQLSRSLSEGGIVLLDEPELHLNPAVCKNLLAFIAEEYATKNDLQFLICSHSPEVLSSAFDREDCSLYHLRDPRNLTIVRSQDQGEISEALRRLGTSTSEGLLYRATIFVEGEHDSDVLELGFEKLLRRYRLRDLGGRRKIETEIASLQDAEKRGASVPPQYFIFDRDEAPTSLKSSEKVRILQWKRRCLENYLLDVGILTDILKDPEVAERPVQNVGEMQNIIKTLAFNQIQDLAVREVYAQYNYENPGLRSSEIQGKTLTEVGQILFARLNEIKKQMQPLNQVKWINEFAVKAESRQSVIKQQWEITWIENADGKRLFSDLQRQLGIKRSQLSLKKAVISAMKAAATENWRNMESLLKDLLGS